MLAPTSGRFINSHVIWERDQPSLFEMHPRGNARSAEPTSVAPTSAGFHQADQQPNAIRSMAPFGALEDCKNAIELRRTGSPVCAHGRTDVGLPDVIGEGGAAAVLFGFADAELGFVADFEEALLVEGLQQAVECPHPSPFPKWERGRTDFVARRVGGGPLDELLEAGFAVVGASGAGADHGAGS